MTVSTNIVKSGPYVGNNVADEFSYGWTVTNKNQVLVYETTDLGVQTLLTVDTYYTVNNIGVDGGGTITRLDGASGPATPLPSGYTWVILANFQNTQETNFTSQGAFFPAVHEAAMDKLTRLVQKLAYQMGLTVKFADESSDSANLDLPTPEADKVLQWNGAANGLENSDLPLQTYVDNAATSETNAAASASAAATSETNAATLASNALSAATSAFTSETNAAASYDSFDDRYLGAKASDPALDNDGNALLTGALYWNTVSPAKMKVWNGASWQAASPVAGNADTLDGLDSTQFVRSDIPSGVNLSFIVGADLSVGDDVQVGNDIQVGNNIEVGGDAEFFGSFFVANPTLGFQATEAFFPSQLIACTKAVVKNAAGDIVQVPSTTLFGGSLTANNRIDRHYWNPATGSFGVSFSAEATSPVAPSYPLGVIPICQAFRSFAAGGVITNADITDERLLLDRTTSESQELISLGGDFTSDDGVWVSRYGNIVTLTSISTPEHASLSVVVSAANIIPTWARPGYDSWNVYSGVFNNSPSNILRQVEVTVGGTLTTRYVDYAGAAFADLDASRFNITYDVTSQ